MKFLGFSLSLRKASYNKKLIKLTEQTVKSNNSEIEILDLLEYDMPSYNEDIQNNQGFPDAAERFKKKLEGAQGLIIASPEYNYSYPGYFKNMFDWVSRYRPMPWTNKAILFLSASPAFAGGERSLWHLRVPFEGCGSFVYPTTFSVPSCYQAFNDNNELADPAAAKRLSDLVVTFIKFSKGLQ